MNKSRYILELLKQKRSAMIASKWADKGITDGSSFFAKHWKTTGALGTAGVAMTAPAAGAGLLGRSLLAPGAMGAAVAIGAGAAVINSVDTNEFGRGIMNAVIGDPLNGEISADEAILGQKINLQTIINPLADRFPALRTPDAFKYMPYILKPGPGLFNENISRFQTARDQYYVDPSRLYGVNKYEVANTKANFENMIGDYSSNTAFSPGQMGMTYNNAAKFSGFTGVPRSRNYGQMNADGAIVFGLHRSRFS